MSSIEQKHRRWPLAGVVVVVAFLTACSLGPTATHQITGTSTSGNAQSLASNDDDYYTTGAACNGFFGGCTTDWYASFKTGDPEPERALSGELQRQERRGRLPVHLRVELAHIGLDPLDEWRIVATDEVSVTKTLPGLTSDWVTPQGHAFVRILTVGNFTSSSADWLAGTGVSVP